MASVMLGWAQPNITALRPTFGRVLRTINCDWPPDLPWPQRRGNRYVFDFPYWEAEHIAKKLEFYD